MLIFAVRGKSKAVILREMREVCPFLLRNVAGNLQLLAQSWFGESQFCKSTFPLSFQLSEAIDGGCEVHFHFKVQVNDTKYLYVGAIVVAEFGMERAGQELLWWGGSWRQDRSSVSFPCFFWFACFVLKQSHQLSVVCSYLWNHRKIYLFTERSELLCQPKVITYLDHLGYK